METVVTLMMLLTVGCFLLKQTFMGVRQILVTAVVVMMFVALLLALCQNHLPVVLSGLVTLV